MLLAMSIAAAHGDAAAAHVPVKSRASGHCSATWAQCLASSHLALHLFLHLSHCPSTHAPQLQLDRRHWWAQMSYCRTGTGQIWAHLKMQNLHFQQKWFVFSSDRGKVITLCYIKSKFSCFYRTNLSSLQIRTSVFIRFDISLFLTLHI